VPLWLPLRRLLRVCLAPKDTAVGSLAQRAGTSMGLRHQRSPAGSGGSGATCAGYATSARGAAGASAAQRNCWSWPASASSTTTTSGAAPTTGAAGAAAAENPAIALDAVRHFPHVLTGLLRAQIWLAPDQQYVLRLLIQLFAAFFMYLPRVFLVCVLLSPSCTVCRYCPKDHSALWNAFSESLLTCWQVVISTLGSRYDAQMLLLPLLAQLFQRVQASVVVPCAPASAATKTDTGAKNENAHNFLDLMPAEASGAEEVAAGVGVSVKAAERFEVHYQPVYLEVLVSLTEQLVAATSSGASVAFLHNVWRWLGTLTSIRANKQQAAVQLQIELAQKNAAAAATAAASTTAPLSLLDSFSLASGGDTSLMGGVVGSSVGGSSGAGQPYEKHADFLLFQSISRVLALTQRHPHLQFACSPPPVGASSVDDLAQVCYCVFRFAGIHPYSIYETNTTLLQFLLLLLLLYCVTYCVCSADNAESLLWCALAAGRQRKYFFRCICAS
jgi:hypothetical protein